MRRMMFFQRDGNGNYGVQEDSSEENGGYFGYKRMIRRHNKRGGSGLTEAQKQAVVDIHNTLRRGEGASDMQMLVSREQSLCTIVKQKGELFFDNDRQSIETF